MRQSFASPVLADVTQPSSCEMVVETTIKRFGRLDILVNNAGRGMKYVSSAFLTEPARFWEIEPETWRMMIDTNVNGPFLMARNAAPVMVEAGWGRIVNVSMNRETMRCGASRRMARRRRRSNRKPSSGRRTLRVRVSP